VKSHAASDTPSPGDARDELLHGIDPREREERLDLRCSFARLGGADDSKFTTRSYHRRSLVSGPHSTSARERASLSP